MRVLTRTQFYSLVALAYLAELGVYLGLSWGIRLIPIGDTGKGVLNVLSLGLVLTIFGAPSYDEYRRITGDPTTPTPRTPVRVHPVMRIVAGLLGIAMASVSVVIFATAKEWDGQFIFGAVGLLIGAVLLFATTITGDDPLIMLVIRRRKR